MLFLLQQLLQKLFIKDTCFKLSHQKNIEFEKRFEVCVGMSRKSSDLEPTNS